MTKSDLGHVAVSLLILAAPAAVAAGQDGVPKQWRRLGGPPAPDSAENRCAGRADTSWVVDYRGPELTASALKRVARLRDRLPYDIDFSGAIDDPPPPPPGPDGRPSPTRPGWARDYARDHAGRRVVQVDDGWLIGFDGGEYGGSLWWYPTRPGAGTKLWSSNVSAIEPGDPGTYVVLTGLDHLGLRQGAVLKVARTDGRWEIASNRNLDGRVWAHARRPDGWLAVTAGSISVISTGGDVRRVIDLPETLATPTSVAIGPTGDVAIGRRLFVSVIQAGHGNRESWFIPTGCRRFENGSVGCRCRGAQRPDAADAPKRSVRARG